LFVIPDNIKAVPKLMKNSKKIRLLFILLLISIVPTVASSAEVFFDTKGTDFWLTFIPNFHQFRNSNYQNLSRGDSLYIFITADQPSSGTIEYKDRNSVLYSKNFTINDITKIYSFSVSWNDFELMGFNDSGALTKRNQSELLAPQYFHVTTDNEVTVYAHSQAYKSSDAFLVLPSDVLSNEYYIISYQSDGKWFTNLSTSSTPSQFAILATLDNTQVTISPAKATMYKGTAPYTITLNKGESYLVQAKIERDNLNADLTGSIISSDKPIAVFSGHQRAILPQSYLTGSEGTTRDILIEQMTPVRTWGANAFLVPYVQPPDITRSGSDLFRILAAFNNTEIMLNDKVVATLNQGEYYEQDLNQPYKMVASNPVLVAQFKKTSQAQDAPKAISDPFMMLLPPKEQYLKSYRVINVQSLEAETAGNVPTGRYFKVYTSHYITVTAPNTCIGNLKVDGTVVSASSYYPIPSSTYYYAHISVSEGTHTVEANDKFGIFIYGYGDANSYGYTGGMEMKPLDLMPPHIASVVDCFKVKGTAYDTTAGDSHINTFVATDTGNVNYSISSFKPYADSVNFSAELVNPYYDGKVTFTATDSMKLKSTKIYEIPGFTVAIKSVRDTLLHINKFLRPQKQFCFDFELENYGKFNQNILNVNLKNKKEFKVNFNTPVIIQSGKTIAGSFCFYADSAGSFYDTLLIEGDCIDRKLIAVNIIAEEDTHKPELYKSKDSCNKLFKAVFTDSLLTDYGIAETKIISEVNCDIRQTRKASGLSEFNIEILDQYKDAYYKISVKDSADQETIVSDTIQGFTLSFPGFASTAKPSIDLGEKVIGDLDCDTIVIHNYGILPFIINDALILNNLLFSIPQSQFPLVIQPNEDKALFVCFSPQKYDSYIKRDTIRLVHDCLYTDIAVSGTGTFIVNDELTNCGLPIKIITKGVTKTFAFKLSPSPIQGLAKINISIPERGKTTIELINTSTAISYKIFDDILEIGDYEIEYTTENLASGVYTCKITNSYKINFVKCVIMH
jgi:hypothetical protein